ncbi:hypothetical protein HDV00_010788 [Rhizophlyctis rosea]|nr:hypothetical protein HDV00_010788 [Rhizophlyctis rosea]
MNAATYAESHFNRFGELRVNQIDGVSPVNVIDNKDGLVHLGLSYDSSLQIVDNKLSVKPRILYNTDYDLRYRDPIKVAWNVDRDPSDTLGGELFLDFSDKDFNLDNGKLETVDLNLTGQGAIGVRKADLALGEVDEKLRVIRLDISNQFQQTGSVLDIRSQGAGRVPFYQIESGFATTGLFNFDGNVLSVPFIKLTESFTLSTNYAASVGYVQYAYQAGVETGVDVSAPIQGRRIISARTDPSSLYINGANQLAVKIDPSGGLKTDPAIGLDVRTDPSGLVKVDPGLGLNVRLNPIGGIKNIASVGLTLSVDNVTVQVGANGLLNANYQVMYPLQRSLNEISCRLRRQPWRSVR